MCLEVAIVQFAFRLLSLYVLKICKYADVSHRGRRNFNNEDQEFEELNEALRVSCEMGYPVRVVRLAFIRAEQNSVALKIASLIE